MSTTYVQALPDVRGRMSYTEFGEGKRRRDHLQNGTDRIAAQMGDMPSRGEFIAYCNGLHAVHPNMVNEGYELRVSWALDELNPGNPDDVQRGMEHAYLLCHELAPDSPCWVTMHVDGEGGCVHAHATIANHDCRTGQVINKDDTSLFAPRVQAVNDELSREWGLSVIGADKDKSTWAEKRDSFDYDSFDRHLGDAVAKARDDASDIDDFKQRLAFAGVTLNGTSKVDKKTGEKSVGWSYRMRDEWGPKRRTRKRRASNLADDLTKEGVERFFEEKQGQQTREALETSPVPKQDSQMVGMEDTQQDSPAQHDFDMYEPSESDVKDMASDLKSVYAMKTSTSGSKEMTAPLREPSFSVNLGGGHAVPACTEVGDSPDVQVEFLVMEHQLVRVLHQEVGVADDVPLEYLVPWCEIPAHEFQRTMFHLVGEDHPADRLGQVRIGLDTVAVHLASPFLSGLLLHAPTRCRRHIGGRERGWA